MSMDPITTGFIGGGNMAEALIKGLIHHGMSPQQIWVADPSVERQLLMRQLYRVQVTDQNAEIIRRCKTIVLAIKPQLVDAVVPALANAFTADHVLISILAGTTALRLEELLGKRARVIRVMPNTPALVGAGVAAICGGRHARPEDIEAAEKLLGTVGTTCLVDEEHMDAVTGVSGSGPAFVFSLIEAMADGGISQGLPKKVALELAVQTVKGAAQLVAETGQDPAALRAKVCSPGGTTLAGLTALDEGNFKGVLLEAVARATQRSMELGQR